MRIKHRYSFNENKKEIITLLENNEVNYTINYGIVVVEVFEDDSIWPQFKKIMDDNKILYPITDVIFNKKEIANADWLRIRSKWRWEYPQPEDNYKSYTYNISNYCDGCGRGLIQKDSFYLKKEPVWGKKQILQLNWIENELFIKSEIISEIKRNSIRGLSFYPVKNIKTKLEFTNINQIKVENTLKPGFIIDDKDIKERNICLKCKQEKLILSGSHIFRLKKEVIRNDLDIVKTNEIFGGGTLIVQLIIVSNKFANLILKKKWQDVVLQPIQLF